MAYTNILNPVHINSLVKQWLEEDGHFDYSLITLENVNCTATITNKQACTLSGLPFVDSLCTLLNCKMVSQVSDGDEISKVRSTIAEIQGSAIDLLRLERVALNILARASGIATQSSKLSTKAAKCMWKGVIAGTRKTTPGFKIVEKYSMLVGGADPHRYDLSTMIMIKDNHIAVGPSLSEIIKETKKNSSFSVKIEVECSTESQALEAAKSGADIVMLDNTDAKTAKNIASEIKKRYRNVLVEISGNVTEANIGNYFSPNIDIISMSSVHQGCSTIDFSMKLEKTPEPKLASTKSQDVSVSNGSSSGARTASKSDSSSSAVKRPASPAIELSGDADVEKDDEKKKPKVEEVEVKKDKDKDKDKEDKTAASASATTTPSVSSTSVSSASKSRSVTRPSTGGQVSGFRGFSNPHARGSSGNKNYASSSGGRGGRGGSGGPGHSYQRGGTSGVNSGDGGRAAYETRRPPPFAPAQQQVGLGVGSGAPLTTGPPILAGNQGWMCRMCGNRNPVHSRQCMRCGRM